MTLRSVINAAAEAPPFWVALTTLSLPQAVSFGRSCLTFALRPTEPPRVDA
jgi:hypothetical protein